MQSDVENAHLVIHEKLEAPILRKTSSDYFWERNTFYDRETNTIHVLNPELLLKAMVAYQKTRLRTLESRRVYKIGLIPIWKMGLVSTLLIGIGVFIALLPVGTINVSTALVFSGILFWPLLYFILRSRPGDVAMKKAFQVMKNPQSLA